MYIDNVAACETGYIPNNPLFGLQLEAEPQVIESVSKLRDEWFKISLKCAKSE